MDTERDYYINELYSILKEEKSFQKLYKNQIIKHKSYFNDYSSVLLEIKGGIKQFLDQIKSNTVRKKTYNRASDGTDHNGTTNRGILSKNTKFQWEVRETIALFNYFSNKKGQTDGIWILDYQTPMKNTNKDKEKGIDLTGTDGKDLYLLEYKRMISDESLLRSVLETYSYRRLIDKGALKFAKDFGYEEANIIPAILMMEGSHQHKTFLEQNCKSPIIKLMNELGVKAFVIKPSKEFVEDSHMKEQLAEEHPEFDFELSIQTCSLE